MNVFFESLGWVGTFCFLWSYYMLISKKWRSDQPIYHWFNIAGSILFVINGTHHSAWAVVFINLAWGMIACYGLIKFFRN
ncbi:CBU_0592 family membrane protein [Flagellimonas sp.]|uniref:CBU_0592 family membrane protein n=1 Tax=Flagellimonas sp. TaxID=2058762 RepID=UPI0034B3F074